MNEQKPEWKVSGIDEGTGKETVMPLDEYKTSEAQKEIEKTNPAWNVNKEAVTEQKVEKEKQKSMMLQDLKNSLLNIFKKAKNATLSEDALLEKLEMQRSGTTVDDIEKRKNTWK